MQEYHGRCISYRLWETCLQYHCTVNAAKEREHVIKGDILVETVVEFKYDKKIKLVYKPEFISQPNELRMLQLSFLIKTPQ